MNCSLAKTRKIKWKDIYRCRFTWKWTNLSFWISWKSSGSTIKSSNQKYVSSSSFLSSLFFSFPPFSSPFFYVVLFHNSFYIFYIFIYVFLLQGQQIPQKRPPLGEQWDYVQSFGGTKSKSKSKETEVRGVGRGRGRGRDRGRRDKMRRKGSEAVLIWE